MKQRVVIMDRDAEWFAEQLSQACPNFDYTASQSPEEAMQRGPDADILIGLAPALPENLLASMNKLKWIHALTTGVDNLLNSRELDPEVYVSNSSGFHGPQMSELALLLMLSTLRDYPRVLENQRAKQWQRWPQPLLWGKTACIIGVGSIAEAMASRFVAFEMTVTGVSDGRSEVENFARIYRREQIGQAVGEAEFVIVLVPYSPSTHHMINGSVIEAMRPDGILINLSRGGCVDEEAVENYLKAGAIRAAALDVFATEPLPESSPLWDTPGITITPHIGGISDNYREQVLPVVINNLNAWQEGGGSALPDRVQRESAA